MTTDKKAESNRRNAQRSTGPRSETGKAVISRNALRHGLLSRHLIIAGESREEFSELLRLLAEDFQPVGLVENALVERVGIALWRQRRLVRAESAEVSLNQQRFGSDEKSDVGHFLNLDYPVYREFRAPAEGTEPDEEVVEANVAYCEEKRKFWQSLLDSHVADEVDPLAALNAKDKKKLLQGLGCDAGQAETIVKKQFGSWAGAFEAYIKYYDILIAKQRAPAVSRLVMQSRALPSQTDLLARYQTALDNDLYKALKALREAQAWRQSRDVINVEPDQSGEDAPGATTVDSELSE